jgi:hypothetical protein
MSWLDNYEREKREKENAEKQRLAEVRRQMEMKMREREEQERKRIEHEKQRQNLIVKKAMELSPMVVGLLDDIGRVEYGKTLWFLRNYDVIVRKNAWELNSPRRHYSTEPSWLATKYQTEDNPARSTHHAEWDALVVELILDGEDFFFAVGRNKEKTQDASLSSLQNILLKILNDNFADYLEHHHEYL